MKPAKREEIEKFSKDELEVWNKKRLQEWSDVCHTDIFQWLKHGEGRWILELLASEAISIGKAAQAVATVFVLKREEIVPCVYCSDAGKTRQECSLCKGSGIVELEPEIETQHKESK